MSYTDPWTAAEDEALKAFYRYKPKDWEGWSEVLPNRTRRAIEARASRIGLKERKEKAKKSVEKAKKIEAVVKKPRGRAKIKPVEWGEWVVYLMGERHMSPSQIDSYMGWPPNRAKYLLMERWEKE